MTGTQSLSFMQLQTIQEEVHRLEIMARRRLDVHETEHGLVYEGQPVTIVIHQADKAYVGTGAGRKYTNVPEASKGADKKVQIHRAYADSRTFWIDRDGNILHRFNA